MPKTDPDEIVDARFTPSDITAVFSGTLGSIKYGDIVKIRRQEALERDDFEIVGEEETSRGVVFIEPEVEEPPVEAPVETPVEAVVEPQPDANEGTPI